MARNNFGDFFKAFNAGFDTVNKVGKDYELSKLAQEKETQAYTAEQGAELEAMANAKDADGNPYYTMGNDPTGKYTVTPNFKNETGAAPAEYAPSTVAAKGVSFLGNNYDAPLTQTQTTGARQQAMAGVMEKYGDAEGAMRYRQQAQQGTLMDMQLAQAKRTGAREDKADAVTATLEGVDQEAGDWMKSRLKNPDGTERVATVDDHLATTQFRANKLMEAGRASEAGALMKDFNAQALVKIQLETAQRTDALKKTSAALAAGDLNAVKDFYNQFTPDGAQVVSVKRDDKGQILIERTTDDGRPMPPHTLKDTGELSAALNSFSDPMALYNWSQNEFRNNLALKADTRAGQSLGIQQAQLGLSQSSHNEKRADTAALRTAGAEYESARQTGNEDGMKAATLKLIQAGGVAPGGANASDPAEVKLANAWIRAGVAKDLAEGLRLATSNNGKSEESIRADMYGKALAANFSNAEEAKKATEEGMAYLTQSAAKPSRSASGKVTGLPAYKDQSEFDAAVKAGKVKAGDKVTVGGRTATWQ